MPWPLPASWSLAGMQSPSLTSSAYSRATSRAWNAQGLMAAIEARTKRSTKLLLQTAVLYSFPSALMLLHCAFPYPTSTSLITFEGDWRVLSAVMFGQNYGVGERESNTGLLYLQGLTLNVPFFLLADEFCSSFLFAFFMVSFCQANCSFLKKKKDIHCSNY